MASIPKVLQQSGSQVIKFLKEANITIPLIYFGPQRDKALQNDFIFAATSFGEYFKYVQTASFSLVSYVQKDSS